MKFSVSRSNFLREIQAIERVVEKKTTVPMLANCLIKARDDRMHIVATDLEVSLETSTDAQVGQSGSIAVGARKLLEIVRAFSAETIEFQTDAKDWATLKAGAAKFKVAGFGEEHFPAVPAMGDKFIALVPAEVLNGLAVRVGCAVTQGESRYALNGARIEVSEGSMRMIATDGHRLACVGTQQVDNRQSFKELIPKRGLGELIAVTNTAEGDVEFSADGSHLFFRHGSRLLSTRTLSGEFPDYKRIIGEPGQQKVTVARAALQEAVSRASIMTEGTSGIALSFSSAGIALNAQMSDLGFAEDRLEVAYEGEAMTVGLNPRYILDFLSVAEGDGVMIHLKNGQHPVMFTPADDKRFEYCYAVMPMRVDLSAMQEKGGE